MFPSDVLAPDLSSHLDALACQCWHESGKVGEQQRKTRKHGDQKEHVTQARSGTLLLVFNISQLWLTS